MYYTPISDLISLVILTQCIVGADHSWSPIVQGRSLVPPTIPPPSILNPVIDNDISGSRAYRRRTWLPLRRRRRRRWYWVPRLQAVQGYPESRAEGFYSAFELRGHPESRAERLYSASQSQGFPQFIKLRSRPSSTINHFKGTPRALEEEEGGFIKGVRGLFGAPEHCLEGGQQYACTFAPVCWLTGGVVSEGCESFMYSCCKPPELGRREIDPLEKRGQDWLHQEPECGISRHRQFAKRIIGGETAKFAELPWQVHIRISSYQCGGVLLNHWYIATAAHCVHRAKLNKITVHLGEYDTKDGETEPLDSETYNVDHITIHPDFRYMLTQPDRYDVALLHLERPVFYQENIIPICLPPLDIPLEGKVGLVAGWGKTDNSFGKTGTNILHKVLVPIVKNEECIKWHEDKNIIVQLHSEMFCAGHKKGKMDACLGDSGGPLIIHYNGRWTLIGITSAGFGCAVDKQPGIYHKIGKTANWILGQISP
ncbi:serine proteinase stubble [Eurytemora carolleeae]|uniref:serine proteinase stubble n=1 Tax=Eurytemora carolleeae TaxID=1294199 RepID=UPI000C7574AD|nr:serine proteinase stubble [Eurytemora carolleeae]|eukprot:XP_023335168.1 serine proteinase stubble-like [Eurytemora affinis]